jgi:hypothetical protein
MLFNGPGKLVGAGGFPSAAAQSFQFIDDLTGVHALKQNAQSFKVALAAVFKNNIMHPAFPQVKCDIGGTGSAGFKVKHQHIPFILYQI